MTIEVECATEAGFCWGVNRAVSLLEGMASPQKPLYSLGAVVHNQQVLERLRAKGVYVACSLDEVKGDAVVVSSHGVSPRVKAEITSRGLRVIDTTCPFVKRAQVAARRFHEAGFFSLVFGDGSHPEVQAILGYAEGHGLALTKPERVLDASPLPRRLGILSQTTQVPAQFLHFVQEIMALVLGRDSEIRIIDTICHDIRRRQQSAVEIARRCDLMLVIGGRDSANTRHLTELSSRFCETHQIEDAAEINLDWLKGSSRIGITSGASTPHETIEAVLERVKELI